MGGTTRFPNGVTTTEKNKPLGSFILPDMTSAHVYMEDFNYFDANNWTVTEVGTSVVTLGNQDGGNLLLQNSAADDDSVFLQKVGESFLFKTGKKLWFDCFIDVIDATLSDVLIGLQVTDTAPLSVTDGVYFIKNSGAATVDFVVVKDSTSTITTGVATLANASFKRLSFFYDGVDSITIFDDGVAVARSSTVNLPNVETLTVSFGIKNGAAAPKTMSIDYIMAAKERPRP